ncbi:MAG: VPLPA-CTERM-specific exosortase XrtD [Marinicaulis sp.]|nr:VPLPA-CTERM-specific exosortase XrtD [Marinicaulis sp.]
MTAADANPSKMNPNMPPLWALTLGAAILVLVVFFWDALGNLWMRWGQQDELSHSYFIPVISGWLVWTNRNAVIKSIGAPSIVGPILVVIAGLMALLGQITHIYVLQHLGIVVSIAGLVAGFGGISLLRVVAAPVAFLFFAVPPPYWVITILSWKFQQMSSVLGVWMIQMMDIPVFLTGNIIDLGNYKLQVAEACSGLRYLFPFLSLGVMTAYLFRGKLWQKAVIVIATIPITIFMNSFRIAVTGALVQAYGTSHAEGALHFFEGWVVFLMCMVALLGVVAVLAYTSKPRKGALDSLGAPDLSPIPPSKGGLPRPHILAGVAGVAALFVGLSQVLTTDDLIIPERKIFAGVPQEFPGWTHSIRPLDPTVAETLGADDSIVVNFITPEQKAINLYMAYLDAQRDGRSWHSPRQCIPGGGWEISQHDIIKGETPSGKPITYNRLIIQNRDVRQLVYYWYDQRGRKVANEFTMKFWLIYDAVMKKRSDGAMVRLITPVSNAAGIEKADAELKAMMDRMDPFLADYVPN